jgi:AcrR family transcriptional regulator
MLDSAVTLLSERGVAGVTVDAVLAHSGAPRGSVYFHFPGGRHELIAGAARQAGDDMSARIEAATRDGDPRGTVELIVDLWKTTLRRTDFMSGCPIVALAVDSRQEGTEIADVVRDVLAGWEQHLRIVFAAAGFGPDRARRLAGFVVAAIEGAIVLARARRDTGPLDDALAELTLLLETR